MILIHREAQVKQLQLSIVAIEQVTTSGTVAASSSHILPQPIESGTFFRVALWIITVGGPDMRLERLYPINLVRLLERRRYHRALHAGLPDLLLGVGEALTGRIAVIAAGALHRTSLKQGSLVAKLYLHCKG